MKLIFPTICLQLLADGGDGGATGNGSMGVTGSVATSQSGSDLSDVVYGIQDESQSQTTDSNQASPVDRSAEFEKLIKGEYKDLYNQRVQDTVQKRLKGSQETIARYEKLNPVLEMLSSKYGVKADDIDGLSKAIQDDDSYYEEEALEKGLSVEQLKEIRKMERENNELKRQMQEQESKDNASKLYAQWMEQAESAKSVYPSFDLRTEMNNPQFVNLLRSNIDVRTAYEVMHKDEIIGSAMQFSAQQTEKKIASKIAANAARPSENGASSQASALVKSDVAQLSKADRQEIIRRVARGERIRF